MQHAEPVSRAAPEARTRPHRRAGPAALDSSPWRLAPLVPALAAIAAYASSLGNTFALDDSHSIQSNPWVRSLAHVPRYFADAATFSTLATNVDYRPVLQATYALDYAISGYDTWAWHLTNLAIHAATAVAVFFFGRRLVGARAIAPLPGLAPRDGDAAALAAAVLFAVHPIASGCVNYISARSSSLVAALVLPAIVLHLRALGERRMAPLAGACVLFALALLTKIEAVSLVAVVAAAEVLLDPAKRARSLPARLLDRASAARLAPYAVLAVAAVALWSHQTAIGDTAARAGRTITAHDYFLTQLRVWWHYVGQVVAPISFVADDPTYPMSRSLAEPRVALAIAGWAIVAVAAALAVRRAPAVAFLAFAFFAWLAPHSSVLPLAEPLNEHRPYLASTSVFLLGAITLAWALARVTRRPRAALAAVVLALSVPLAMVSRERNLVWRSELALWEDTARKAPGSTRAQMNHGLALMRAGRLGEAEERFREAARLGPAYALARTNLAIALHAQGRSEEAAVEHDRAVRLPGGNATPRYWRARFRAARGDYAGAIDDLEAAAAASATPFQAWAALSEVLAVVGRDAEASAVAERGLALDPAGFASERAAFRATALAGVGAMAVMNQGVAQMRAGRLAEAEAAFLRAAALDPASDLVQTNLGIVRAARGRLDEARAAHAAAIALAPASSSPLYWRGRFAAEQGDLEAAARDLSIAAERAPQSVRELAALAECLDRLGRSSEAEAVSARGRAIDGAAFARERAAVAAEVFARPGTPPAPIAR